MSIFSERTSTLMHQYGLNQKDLAKMAGVTESAMSYYIKGERTPRSDVLTRIAKALIPLPITYWESQTHLHNPRTRNYIIYSAISKN